MFKLSKDIRRAELDPLAARIRPTGRMFDTPARVIPEPVYGEPVHSLLSSIVPNLVAVPPEFHWG